MRRMEQRENESLSSLNREKMKSGLSLAPKIHGIKAFWADQRACRKGSGGTSRHPMMSHSQELLCPASSGPGHAYRMMWQLSPVGQFEQ